MKIQVQFRLGLLSVLLSGCACIIDARADTPIPLSQTMDSWSIDGQHGLVYVTGSLTQSACRLAMTSGYQTVEMGNIETSELQRNGKGSPVPLLIELEDCVETLPHSDDLKSSKMVWNLSQPAVKVRFLAPTVPSMPDVASVTGAKGLGLEIMTPGGALLPLGQNSQPHMLPTGQSMLTYYVIPVKTGVLEPGNYSALIAFEMLYD